MSEIKLAGIAQLARLYSDIALLRRGPADVPASTALLALTVLAYFAINVVMALLLPAYFAQALGQLLVEIAFMFAWYRGVLLLAGYPERFLQTATSLFGYQTLLAPLVIGGQTLYRLYGNEPAGQVPLSFFIIGLLAWTLAVSGRILRAATQWPLFACVGMVVLQAIVELALVMALFGAPQEN
ncbi:MAG: hypothetical protein ABIT36_06130 [Steroidobacteraceae bacterium]